MRSLLHLAFHLALLLTLFLGKLLILLVILLLGSLNLRLGDYDRTGRHLTRLVHIWLLLRLVLLVLLAARGEGAAFCTAEERAQAAAGGILEESAFLFGLCVGGFLLRSLFVSGQSVGLRFRGGFRLRFRLRARPGLVEKGRGGFLGCVACRNGTGLRLRLGVGGCGFGLAAALLGRRSLGGLGGCFGCDCRRYFLGGCFWLAATFFGSG